MKEYGYEATEYVVNQWTAFHDDSPEVILACQLSKENHAYFHPVA